MHKQYIVIVDVQILAHVNSVIRIIISETTNVLRTLTMKGVQLLPQPEKKSAKVKHLYHFVLI